MTLAEHPQPPPADQQQERPAHPTSRRVLPLVGLPVQPQALREDRILHEIYATGGDVRRICDLFGMSIDAALRYTTGLEPAERTGTSPFPTRR